MKYWDDWVAEDAQKALKEVGRDDELEPDINENISYGDVQDKVFYIPNTDEPFDLERILRYKWTIPLKAVEVSKSEKSEESE